MMVSVLIQILVYSSKLFSYYFALLSDGKKPACHPEISIHFVIICFSEVMGMGSLIQLFQL